MNGIVFVNKERDWTSFDVCARLRRIFNEKKVGHTGTLDPFAEGLMIVALGNATKVIPFLEDLDKEYIATLKLGSATETEDLTGEIVETKTVPQLTEGKIKTVLNSFLGKSTQIPPMYSAIKYNGKPLYFYAREGIEIERTPREIDVKNIELISFEDDTIVFKAEVSKGTYIRTLASDIARKLDTAGHLTKLVRTKISKYSLDNANLVNDINESLVNNIESVLTHLEVIVVDEKIEMDIRNGKVLILKEVKEDLVYLKNNNNIPLAIYYRVKENLFKSKRGLF